MVIPVNHVDYMNMYVVLDGHDHELAVDAQIECGKILPRCVAKIDEENSVVLPFTNLTNEDMIITRNDVMAKAAICCLEPENAELGEINKSSDKFNIEDIKVGDRLSEDEKLDLYNLLQKYEDCFAIHLGELGTTTGHECKIETVTEARLTFRPYRLSIGEKIKAREIVEELRRAGIVV